MCRIRLVAFGYVEDESDNKKEVEAVVDADNSDGWKYPCPRQ